MGSSRLGLMSFYLPDIRLIGSRELSNLVFCGFSTGCANSTSWTPGVRQDRKRPGRDLAGGPLISPTLAKFEFGGFSAPGTAYVSEMAATDEEFEAALDRANM
jgi:hypothetical protein